MNPRRPSSMQGILVWKEYDGYYIPRLQRYGENDVAYDLSDVFDKPGGIPSAFAQFLQNPQITNEDPSQKKFWHLSIAPSAVNNREIVVLIGNEARDLQEFSGWSSKYAFEQKAQATYMRGREKCFLKPDYEIHVNKQDINRIIIGNVEERDVAGFHEMGSRIDGNKSLKIKQTVFGIETEAIDRKVGKTKFSRMHNALKPNFSDTWSQEAAYEINNDKEKNRVVSRGDSLGVSTSTGDIREISLFEKTSEFPGCGSGIIVFL
jgi:hypothetical protein